MSRDARAVERLVVDLHKAWMMGGRDERAHESRARSHDWSHAMNNEELRDSDPTPVRPFPGVSPPNVAWERVKDAFRRDWMQTKADFSGEGSSSLNQNAGDTVVQALGAADMPAADSKTRASTPKESAHVAAKAFERMLDVTRTSGDGIAKAEAVIDEQRSVLNAKVGEIQREAAEAKAIADRKIMEVTRVADHDILRQQAKIAVENAKRIDAEVSWRQAEREARFGYTVRMQRPNEAWSDALDKSLRAEWELTGDTRAWEDARPGVRSGWEFGRSKI